MPIPDQPGNPIYQLFMRFFGEEMRTTRKAAAEYLRRYYFHQNNEDIVEDNDLGDPLSEILDFFELIGLQTRNGELDMELTYETFYPFVLRYYPAAQKYIEETRHSEADKDKTAWENFEWLYKEVLSKREPLPEETIKAFFEDEVNRGNSAAGTPRGYEAWLETLPFPLASILWRYYADAELHDKNDHLLHFFEATAQFCATLMLSAFHSDEQFFKERRQDWLDSPSTSACSWQRSTFGDWVILGERLAKFTRRMLSSDREQRERCFALYKTRNPKHIEALINKELFATLKRVNRHRNNWIGHGGIASTSEQQQRLTILEEEQTQIRKVFSDIFDDWLLIRPGRSEYRDGVFHYDITSLMGTRTIFRHIPVQTSVPMDVEKLYLLDTNMHTPLEIVPFFRMMPSPRTAEHACYFYNRMEREGIRWISYHFEQEAEVHQPDQALLQLIRDLDAQEM